jgi:hypothetical protein
MKIQFEDWDESILDLEDYKAERALQGAVLDAIHRARRCGTDYVIWERGRVKSVKPDKTGPYEKIALRNLARINRRIAKLQAQSPGAPAPTERPEPVEERPQPQAPPP